MSAAVIISRQNRYMHVFRAAGAVSPDTARSLEELNLRRSWIFNGMVRRGVFEAVGDERWYLSEPGADAFVRRRNKVMLVFLAISIVVLILVLVFAGR